MTSETFDATGANSDAPSMRPHPTEPTTVRLGFERKRWLTEHPDRADDDDVRCLMGEVERLEARWDHAEQLLICISENALPEAPRPKARAFEIDRTTMDTIDAFLWGDVVK